MTSDTNSCVILKDIPVDDDHDMNDIELDTSEGDIDPDTTMIMDSPQAQFQKKTRKKINVYVLLRSYNMAHIIWCITIWL